METKTGLAAVEVGGHRVAEGPEQSEQSEPENSSVQGEGPQSLPEEMSGDERTNTYVR